MVQSKKYITKRVNIILVFLVMLSCGLLVNEKIVRAENVYSYGNYHYTILSDGTIRIGDYLGKTNTIKELDVPEKINDRQVTVIGDCVFEDCINLEVIKIPDGVTDIGKRAFKNCSNLSEISIPDSVTTMGDEMFSDCSKLASISLPSNITKIGNEMFAECSNLQTITIPVNVTSIGEYAFWDCTKLKQIVFLSNRNLKWIGDYAFSDCENLISISIPDSVEEIEQGIFEECSKLKSVVIPSNITEIKQYTFRGCSSLTKMNISSNVRKMGEEIFVGCSNLEEISVDPLNNWYCSEDGILFDKDKSKILCYPINKSGNNYVIPSSVVYIEYCAFAQCVNLTEIEIPPSVTSIAEYAFYGCDDLTLIVNEGSYAEQYAMKYKMSYEYKENSDDSQGSGNGNGISDGIGDTEKGDEGGTSSNPNPSDGTTDGTAGNNSAGTFGDQTTGEDQTTTPDSAAKGTVLQATSKKCKVVVTSSDASNPCVAYKETTNKKASNITIPDSVTIDGITYKVTSIADNALAKNKQITEVTVGKNITSIGKNAFKNCTNLKTVEVKSTTLNKIGANAFSGAKKLTKITIKTTKLTKKSIGKNALKGTNKKLVIKVPKKMVSKYQTYFKGKGNKTVKVKK